MAHGRAGPDIVMTTRYAGASEIRALSEHEAKRTPDGSSAIDPDRSHLNQILLGPGTQQEALDQLWAEGVRRPTAQAEAPYVQMTLSASPQFFRDEGQGPGEWNQEKLDAWCNRTMSWLRHEFGKDLVHVSLHLDETTPHLHVLIVPTYEKKPRVPGRQKRGETIQEFEARRAAAQDAETIRTAGRSSSLYWRRVWARREARKSYHAAVEELGLGYGRDFVEEGEPSPKRVPTGTWVKEKAAELVQREAQIEELEQAARADRQAAAEAKEAAAQERAGIEADRKVINDIRSRLDGQKAGVKNMEAAAKERYEKNEKVRRDLDRREADLDARESLITRMTGRLRTLVSKIAEALGIDMSDSLEAAIDDIEAELKPKPSPKRAFGAPLEPVSAPEDPSEDSDGPGF